MEKKRVNSGWIAEEKEVNEQTSEEMEDGQSKKVGGRYKDRMGSKLTITKEIER